MPERLTPSEPPAPAGLGGAPPLQRLARGLLVGVLGGVMLSQTLFGLPVLVAGAWLSAGRGWRELRDAARQNRGYVIRGLLSAAVFAAALWQARFAVLPALPLFAISIVLAGARLSPLVRECCVALLLGLYGYLLSQALSP